MTDVLPKSLQELVQIGEKLTRRSLGPLEANTGVPAAVACPLLLPAWESPPDGGSLLFIKRSERLRKHAGQMAFPGGVQDPEDPDLWATALREAREEIALQSGECRFLATLPSASTPSGFRLQPYLIATTQQQFEAQVSEVDSIHPIPIQELLSCPVRLEQRTWDGRSYRVIYFETNSVCIWGVTGRILEVLLTEFFSWEGPK